MFSKKELDFEVKRGEAHALVGENGAGKSTLMKIIVREYQEDKGNVFIQDQNVRHLGIREVQRLGLSLIHQDLNLVPMFTVAHNICLGFEPLTKFKTVDWKGMREQAAPFLAEVCQSRRPEYFSTTARNGCPCPCNAPPNPHLGRTDCQTGSDFRRFPF